ncbi:GNAT family N-acetyltransferase [Spongiimicrobium sp. 2-473A-2-J]|uniref:GNAT family N-acetyltransferase n=1 Tax=Eudoraea algarum TaxID=3417568 RepID=UPI003D36FA74
MLKIRKATQDDVPQLAPLFDLYRIFYGQESNSPAARAFLTERITKGESVIFLAELHGETVGFTQLYKTFSSVSLEAVFILNDLYVSKSHRGKRIGEALLNRAQAYCSEKNFKGLALETAVDNPAQKLYERLGWKKDSHCFHYFWKAP